MDAIVTFFIALMPFLAVAPLALALVVVSALVASPRIRNTLADWVQRRLGAAPRAPAAVADEPADGELEARIRHLESRLAFMERVLTRAPRPDDAPALPAPPPAARRPITPPS